MSSEIDPKNIIMVTLEEISEQQRKAFEVHRQAVEERRKAKRCESSRSFSPASRRRGNARSLRSRRPFSLLPATKLR
jgi:hypothetical protein